MAVQTPKPSTLLSKTSPKVAVIGAGAAGLVTDRELIREGHRVVVFEHSDKVGGTWNYDPDVESDPLGLDPSRRIVHSSMFDSVRTNLPREVMGFCDFPFVVRDGMDSRRFPGHQEVFLYLDDFAPAFDLTELIRFGTEVFGVRIVREGRWMVRSRRVLMDGEDEMVYVEEVYDGMVVCYGHHTEPLIADIPGT